MRGRAADSDPTYDCAVPWLENVFRDFWIPNSPGIQPPLTDAMVAEAERVLGVTLPGTLIELLKIQNGGVVHDNHDAYPTPPNHYSTDHIPFTHVMGIPALGPRPPITQAITLLDTPYLIGEWDLPEPIVLLYGEGHFWVALDYRNRHPQSEPSVVWIDNEFGEELTLAPDFRAFIEGLIPTPPDQD
jgi:hypothetical protein